MKDKTFHRLGGVGSAETLSHHRNYTSKRTFVRRAVGAGAFGQSDPPDDMRYYLSPEGTGLGWHWSEPNQKPCLIGLYSEAHPRDFRKGLRHVLYAMQEAFETSGYKQVLAALDYRHKCFARLLRMYQRYAGFQVVGETETSVVLVTDAENLRRF